MTHYLMPNISAQGTGFQATWTDYDLDGDLDIYVANDSFVGNPPQHNVMWQNGGAGCGGWCFTDVSASNGSGIDIADMGLLVADLHNDGFWDIYNSNIRENVLLRGLAGGQFVDATDGARLARGFFGQWYSVTWGMAAIDYDNDQYLDIYLVAGQTRDGNPNQAGLQPDALFRNRGGSEAGVFDEVSVFSGVDNELMGRTAAYADYNKDGAVDLYLSNFGDASFLFHNTLHTGNWLQLELQGRGGPAPRDPAGATVRLTTPDGINQHRAVQIGTGLGNGHDQALYFGLGDNTSVRRMMITWPDGRVTRIRNFTNINRRLRLVQPASGSEPPSLIPLSDG